MIDTAIETREDIERAHREGLVAFLEANGFQCYDHENEECLRTAALDHWDTENKTEFKFTELSDKAKENAIQTHAHPDHDWWEGTYAFFMDPESDERKQGFVINDISFSGFWSQGDGASWAGTVQLPEFIKHFYTADEQQVMREAMLALIFEGAMDSRVRITTAGRYSHEYTMDVADIEVYDSGTEFGERCTYEGVFNGALVTTLRDLVDADDRKALVDLEEAVLEEARNIARRIYKSLEEDYDYLSSEEAFAESAAANDWRFTADGNLL